MIEDAVRAVLLADASVLALATGGVRTPPLPQVTAPASQLPVIHYQRIGGSRGLSQDGPGLRQYRVQVDVWGQSYRSAGALGDLVAVALHGFPRAGQSGTQAGEAIQLIELVPGSASLEYDAEVKLHRASADFWVTAAAAAIAA